MSDLVARARAWAIADPDPSDRAEIEALLAAGTGTARHELADRFGGRLRFGTAGLRGAMGAGPNRMNRAVVRATTAALARWLGAHRPAADASGVVIGCDARHRSVALADEASAVLAGAGIPVLRLEDRRPTPLLAFAVRALGASAGIMITASHNPPADNGYKLYLADGAQIVPPVDAEIEALIDEVGPLDAVPLGDVAGPLVRRVGPEVVDAYVTAVVAASPPALRPPRPPLVVYTPLHGVAGPLFLDALGRAGHPAPAVVSAQAEPDPGFPTVARPNPEEPGALDLALSDARRLGADVVLAHDPDGDRLAVAVPDAAAEGGWRRLSGDELGALLGAFLLGRARDGWQPAPGARRDRPPVVAASIVSSTLLEKLAEAAGVAYVATLTGFKWIVRAIAAVPGSWLLFGYEEALGYAVGEVVRDKDGIAAALAVLALAGELAAGGSSLLDRLDELACRHGLHATAQRSVAVRDAAALMAHLRAHEPRAFDGDAVVRTLDLAGGGVWQPGRPPLPPADVVALHLDSGARVIVRPSGTEPKLKVYLEVVRPVAGGDAPGARRAASAELDALGAAVVERLAG